MHNTGIGFTLQPDDEFLALTAEVAAKADYLEVAPETMWIEREDGALDPNGFHPRFLAAGRAMGKRFLAHGTGYALGSSARSERARRTRWRERMAVDHALFDFAWWTDHAWTTTLAGENVGLPVALPPTTETERAVTRRLAEMRTVVPDVGLENSALHFVLGDPLDDARALARSLGRGGGYLLLDLHNLLVMAENLDFDPHAWIARVDLARVIEIHIAGGKRSDPEWLPSGRTLRLDSHDAAVPESVWSMLARVLPRCSSLRAVTLERMEGTVCSEADARQLADELHRARSYVAEAR